MNSLDQATVQLKRVDCAHCGTLFAITDDFMRRRREDHGGFYCPSGHSNYYPHTSDLEIARKEAERAKRDADWQRERANNLAANLASERHKVAAERGAKTKLKKKLDRVAHGVCPCCKRTFGDLRRHIATKHPEFIPASAPSASSVVKNP